MKWRKSLEIEMRGLQRPTKPRKTWMSRCCFANFYFYNAKLLHLFFNLILFIFTWNISFIYVLLIIHFYHLICRKENKFVFRMLKYLSGLFIKLCQVKGRWKTLARPVKQCIIRFIFSDARKQFFSCVVWYSN